VYTTYSARQVPFLLRKELWVWEEETFCGSHREEEMVKVRRELMERLTDAVCYAA
jgi:hypothetical protein